MSVERLSEFLRKEWRAFIDDAIRPARTPDAPPDEGRLIEQATDGAECRTFLHSPAVQDFMARSEAQLTTALINTPLVEDLERLRLAISVQTVRQLQKYLLAKATDGIAAERELERLRKGDRTFF